MIATAIVPKEAIAFHLVRGPVVYFLMLGDECVYVGSTCSLSTRIGTHQATTRKHPELGFDAVRYIHVERSKLLETERYWQKKLKPRNRMAVKSGLAVCLPGKYRDLLRKVQSLTGDSMSKIVQKALRAECRDLGITITTT